jgi:hypothetical protein
VIVLQSVAQSCCQNATGIQYACLGRDIESRSAPTPMAVYWTVRTSTERKTPSPNVIKAFASVTSVFTILRL